MTKRNDDAGGPLTFMSALRADIRRDPTILPAVLFLLAPFTSVFASMQFAGLLMFIALGWLAWVQTRHIAGVAVVAGLALLALVMLG
jgi:hypothetical protein